jgi:hypothetical protein
MPEVWPAATCAERDEASRLPPSTLLPSVSSPPIMKHCPSCARSITASAKTCDFCNYEFATGTPAKEQSKVTASRTKNSVAVLLFGLGILALVGGIYLYGYEKLQQPMNDAMQSDPRNVGIEVAVHYENWIPGGSMIYDLRDISSDKSPADVFRLFLQYAAKMKEERFERVVLAHRGDQKFYIDGSYFQKLGEEYDVQNPVYTVRTFPENVRRMNGTAAFEHWEGGIFAVAKHQMEDFEEFYRDWFVSDLR